MSVLSHDIRIPRGVSDKLPGFAFRMQNVESTVLRVARLWGYQFIQPSPLEFEDVLVLGMGHELVGKAFRFDDWESTRLLAIPPDITPQMARISANRLQGLRYPHRLSYSGVVLRHSESQSGHHREVFQAGAELIGKAGPDADVEVLSMAVQIANECGLEDITINLSHVGICQGALDCFHGSSDDLKCLKQAIARKDKAAVLSICEKNGSSPEIRDQLVSLTRLFGGNEVLEDAAQIQWNETTCNAINELQAVVQLLKESGVSTERICTFDLGETRGLGYHTGVSFECVSPLSTEVLFSGGRYDRLMQRYGVEMPATGFTCDVLALARVMDLQNGQNVPTIDLCVVTSSNCLQDEINQLRHKGISVIVERDGWTYESALSYAIEHNVRFLLMITDRGCKIIRCVDGMDWELDGLVTDSIAKIVINH